MIIIGAVRRQGEFNGLHYDNYYLYFENPNVKTLFGIAPQFEKVSVDVVNSPIWSSMLHGDTTIPEG